MRDTDEPDQKRGWFVVSADLRTVAGPMRDRATANALALKLGSSHTVRFCTERELRREAE